MPIKLLALDLDGTLVHEFHNISPVVQNAIQSVLDQEIKVVIATGRAYAEAEKFIHLLGLDTPIICFQGGLIYDPGQDKIIYRRTMQPALAARIIDLTRQRRLPFHLFYKDKIYVENPSEQSRLLLSTVGSPVEEVSDLKQFLSEPPIKGLVVSPLDESNKLLAELHEKLSHEPITLTRSLDMLIEILPQDVSKGSALIELARMYGIAQEEVMAIGDHDNDVEMLEWAGLSVAMGNGSQQAKAAAQYIVPPITEDGVAYAIEKFILPPF